MNVGRIHILPLVSVVLTGLVSGCTSGGGVLSSATKSSSKKSSSHINTKTKFSSRTYGVAASPRVTTSHVIRRGGGRRQIGKPYKIKGKWYSPREEPGYVRTGQASWYGPNFHGRLTANGEIYDQYSLSGAHPTFPLPSYARVTNAANGNSVVVRVNDRGPYHEGRVIDLSAKAAELLNYRHKGVATVKVEYLGQAPLHGKDQQYLASSFNRSGGSPASDAPVIAAVTVDQPVRAPVKSNVAFRPAGIIRNEMLDTMSTGSVKVGKASTQNDPFIMELQAINRKIDTGSTIAKRLQSQFIMGNKLK